MKFFGEKNQKIYLTNFLKFNEKTFAIDEGPRSPDIEKIKSLSPAFDAEGSITAATSSPISLGASALLITNKEIADQSNEIFEIVSRSVIGVDWKTMGQGPLPATEKALKNANLSLNDIDVIELNEAFASQSLACIQELNIDEKKVNLDGGALALGHPLGATGARITGKAAELLRRENKKYALATQCIGLGMGIATVIESVN